MWVELQKEEMLDCNGGESNSKRSVLDWLIKLFT